MKSVLYQHCIQVNNDKIATIQRRILSLEESRDNETKSSAGDKYETGRAMMQIDIENSNRQLAEALKTKAELEQTNHEKTYDSVQKGALVQLNTGLFFICAALGKIKIDTKTYYAISSNAPIAKAMLGLQKGDDFVFNQRRIKVIAIN